MSIADSILDEEGKREYEKRTFTYQGKEFELHVNNYLEAKMAMAIEINEAGEKDPSNRARISVNLGNFQSPGSFVQFCSTFIDINNYPGAEKMLQETGLAEPYTKWGSVVEKQSGFVSYPVYTFNQEKLRQLDPQGFDKYQDTWSRQLGIEQEKMNIEMFGNFDERF